MRLDGITMHGETLKILIGKPHGRKRV